MIIKFTVHDNDFDYMISPFISDLYMKIVYGIEPSNPSDDFYVKAYKTQKKFSALLNPNSDIVLTEENKKDIIERIKEVFGDYLNRRTDDKGTIDYLMNNLEVEFLKFFEDKWENGEAYYWLQHSNKVVNQ